jgi:chemotaxis protein methyltransferase CheR
MDVIFCRNVIMYFSPEVMRRVIGNLHGALREGGYLFVAPSEASQELFPQFVRQSLRGEILFKKDTAALAEQEARKLAPRAGAATAAMIAGRSKAKVAAPARKLVAVPRPPTPARHRQPAPAKAAAKAPADAGALAAAARAAANQGRLNEALGQVEQAIAADKVEAVYHYLYATILEELARPEDAVKALTSALFLDPDLALAHFLNGNIARRAGRAAEAERHFQKTLVALETRPADEILPESEGMTAGKLAEIVKSLLEMEVAR